MLCDDIPLLLWFQLDNNFSESEGALRYCIDPTKNEEEENTLTVSIWRGLYCKEKSKILRTEVFPMTDDALKQIADYVRKAFAELK